MTAAEIINLLKKHRNAMATLRLWIERIDDVDRVRFGPWTNIVLQSMSSEVVTAVGRQFITGACVEKCDELGLQVHREVGGDGGWYWFDGETLDIDETTYPTRLATMLAAIEKHTSKEITDGTDAAVGPPLPPA